MCQFSKFGHKLLSSITLTFHVKKMRVRGHRTQKQTQENNLKITSTKIGVFFFTKLTCKLVKYAYML